MDRILLALLAAVLGAAALWMVVRSRRAATARAAARRRYLDACAPLLADADLSVAPTGFPRLTGRHGGARFEARVLPDMLTFRKLPALWVLVTLVEPQPLAGTLQLMLRPSGLEPFADPARLPVSLERPSDFPADCAIHADRAGPILPAERLRPHLAVFDDPRAKELLLDPRGLRLTFLAEEADRTRFLLFRDAELGAAPLDPARLRDAMDRLLALRAALADAPTMETAS